MKKVAVVNRTNLINYGSVLQVLALCEAVKSLGYESEVIWEEGSVTKNLDLRPRKIIYILFKLLRYPQFIKGTIQDLHSVGRVEHSNATKELFKSFVERYIPRRFFDHDRMKEIGKGNMYHRFICGSDQIWSSTTLYPDPLMYLRFAPEEKRVAYAPSLGRSYIPDYNKRILRKYISQIPYVSIRETEGATLLKELIGTDVPVVLDPTLLFDKTFWLKYSANINECDYVLCYFLNEPSQSVQNEIIKYAKGKKIIVLRSKLQYLSDKYQNVKHPDIGPAEFIAYISNSDFVFTDSYHGMLFAINFEKEFLSVERNYGQFNQSTRQKSILGQLNIKGRYNRSGIVEPTILDYDKINTCLTSLRQESFKYLKNALK